MLVETRDGATERRVLISLVVDRSVLARLSPQWQRDLFYSPWANLIGRWCINHFKKYGKPLNRGIEAQYRQWAERKGSVKESIAKAVEEFIVSLSNEYEKTDEDLNPDLALEIAHEHFNRVRLTRLVDQLRGDLEAGFIDKAEEKVLTYNRIALGEQVGADLLIDEPEVESTFFTEEADLFAYPEGAGQFFRGQLGRDSFVAFLGGEKSGKSWWLIDLAWRAMLARRKVAFFEVGDMSKRQIKRRILSRAAAHPFRSLSPSGEWPFAARIPTKITKPPKGTHVAPLDFRKEVFDGPLNKQIAWAACAEIMQRQVKSNNSYFRLSVHPNSSISVEGIRSILKQWELKEWVPDVIVIDYADILAHPKGSKESRDGINETWKQLRGLNLETHCLLATATQANRESYGKTIMDRRNISDDKRKLAEVTMMVGINVAGDEKKNGQYRLNVIGLRDGEYDSRRCCYVAGSLSIANPCVVSVF